MWPPALGPRPIPGTETTKPPWMFLVFYPLEDWFGLSALLWAPIVLFAALALVPFLDRSRYRSPMRRRAFIAIGVVVAIAASSPARAAGGDGAWAAAAKPSIKARAVEHANRSFMTKPSIGIFAEPPPWTAAT